MLQETIFNLNDLSDEEKTVLLYPDIEVVADRRNNKSFRGNLYKPLEKDEYYLIRSQERAYFDLFWVFRYRGDFELARQYELLANHDAVLSMESSGSDCFMRNEYEYYVWRKHCK